MSSVHLFDMAFLLQIFVYIFCIILCLFDIIITVFQVLSYHLKGCLGVGVRGGGGGWGDLI